MSNSLSLLGILAVTVISSPDQIIPTKPGTTWNYDMTEEAGPGAQLADENLNPDRKSVV